MTRRKFGYLGALSAVIVASGCGSADTSLTNSASQSTAEEELGESFPNCVAATTDNFTGGTLTIDAHTNTTGVVILSPGNSVVKVNGRTCKMVSGANIALSTVSKISVLGKANSTDTFVLDFSAGLPTGSLLSSGGITIDGNETVASTTTPDTIIIKGSTKADPVAVGMDAAADGTINISLSATNKTNHVALKKVGQATATGYQPNLIFSLGGGDDTFTANGGFGSPAATAMTYGISVYGGAGNDTITGGAGADKIDGGGQVGDTLDYSGRTSDVYVDMDSTKVTVWGGSLRGVAMTATDSLYINPGDGTSRQVTFAATDITPALIAAKINGTGGLTGVASVVGGRLRLASTHANNYVAITSASTGSALTKLGLYAGYYSTLGNDGTPGGQLDVPSAAPTARQNSHAYAVGDVVVPAFGNGFWYKATVAGTSGTYEPAWPTTIGDVTASDDGAGVRWKCMGKVTRATQTAPDGWTAKVYAAGDTVQPGTPNGYWYKTTAGGDASSGAADPGGSWGTTLGDTTNDGVVDWVCMGRIGTTTNYNPGDAVWDVARKALYQVAAKAKSDGSAPTFDTTPGNTLADSGIVWTTLAASVAARANTTVYALNAYITSGGYYYKAVALLAGTGTSAGSAPAMPTATGAMVTDGTVVWKCMGPAPTVAINTYYGIGDTAVDGAGTIATVTSLGTLSTTAAVALPASPADTADGNFKWLSMGGLAERDDVQGIAVITGGTGHDILIGNSAANTLNGGDGNDILSGGPYMTVSTSCPMDKLNGGNGNDWFDMGYDDAAGAAPTKFDCNQTIAGGAGIDLVDYSQRSSYGNLVVKLDGATASGEQTTSPREGDKIGTDVEVLLGGAGNDVITGSANNDFLFGGPGDDIISAGAGDDTLYGGSGNDKLYGEAGSDSFYELTAYPTSTAWNEPLAGGTWAGVALAVYGSDKPGDGDDLVLGGPDLTETNKVDFSDSTAAVKIAICSSASATPTALGQCTTANSDYVGISSDGTGATANTYINVEYVVGALLQANTFIGSINNETFEGGVLVDTVLGQGGQDTLFGYPDPSSGIGIDNASSDLICGGDDDDYVYGGAASSLEGEGQMDQARATQATTAVLINGSTPQAPSDCVGMTGFAQIPGVNACFGQTGATKAHCAN